MTTSIPLLSPLYSPLPSPAQKKIKKFCSNKPFLKNVASLLQDNGHRGNQTNHPYNGNTNQKPICVMKSTIITTITNVFDLIAKIATAKNRGQFATIEAETEVKANQFPNEEYSNAHGILFPMPKTKAYAEYREQYRYKGKATKRFKVEFHFDKSYDNELAKHGLTRSENGTNRKTDHFGSIAIGYESTTNVLLCYMPDWYLGKAEYYLDGHKASEEEVAYINGYKVKSNNAVIEYRTVGVKNVRTLSFGGNTYIVNIDTITPTDYDALKALYCAKTETETEVA